MKTSNGTVVLTPSQADFCTKHISGFCADTWHVTVAGTAGSERQFLRVSPADKSGFSCILVLWNSRDVDWNRFMQINVEVARWFPLLPRIYAADAQHGLILEEDCGQQTMKAVCAGMSDPAAIEGLYGQALDALIRWQCIDTAHCPELSSRVLDKEVFLWETEYFTTHCVSEFFGLDALLTPEWNRERETLAQAASALPLVPLHRDFQSENIMVQNNGVKLVDYQGARLGAAEYDIASLLFDPYVSLPGGNFRYGLFEYYIRNSKRSVDRNTLHTAALQRLCQALGAYGNLSLHKGKEHYKKFIPIALHTLQNLLEDETGFPLLRQIVRECNNRVEKPPLR